ncbi:glutathione S-transferase [Legionella lytica]|uniref:Glutathione S-transferase n=1 Tax=Legionella lytica TaxID=96232 RepID=A0ABY4YAY9_9GAMM|nr:glutathione S-transferase [Legionella lytica]USQ14823.1 glutathione S-transferase [Legionella lytica]
MQTNNYPVVSIMDIPVLYTFRRCPYAIRARMTLAYAQIPVTQYEVDLKNKPIELLQHSPKGTVPVLVLPNNLVIDQSIDIMMWALKQSDPEGWLNPKLQATSDELISQNDTQFKPILDRYKYSQDPEVASNYREQAHRYLQELDSLLASRPYLLSEHISLADVALFPFIRQFGMVDQAWFAQSEYTHLQTWLHSFLDSELFLRVMQKTSLPKTTPPN